MYINHTQRLSSAVKKQDEEDEEMKENLEQAYISLQFGNKKKENVENEKRAAKMLEKY